MVNNVLIDGRTLKLKPKVCASLRAIDSTTLRDIIRVVAYSGYNQCAQKDASEALAYLRWRCNQRTKKSNAMNDFQAPLQHHGQRVTAETFTGVA